MGKISEKEIKKLAKEYQENSRAEVVRNALVLNSIDSIATVYDARPQNPFFFSVNLDTHKVTEQGRSGRCWIFSSMNVLREKIAKKYDIDGQFELSQNFIAFYDKVEKANWFMTCVEEEIAKGSSLHDRAFQWLLDNAVGDGGQWNMVVALIEKYGLCPKSAMPETYQSSHTAAMNGILNKRLRRFALAAKRLHDEGQDKKIGALHEETLAQCYELICDCFGCPPQSFTFEYYDKKKKYHAHRGVTPKEFYEKYLGEDLKDVVVLINGPTADKPFHHLYSVQYIGNVAGAVNTRYLNLPMKELKKAVISQLTAGEPVWFGCDCGKDGLRSEGLWDDKAFAYDKAFGMDLEMTKAEMLDSRQSAMNHAMVLTGVNLVNKKPTRWKIENSWGDKVAQEGYYTASDSWFDLYVYEAAVHKKYLTAAQREMLKGKVTVLDPWDPFGTLAD